MYQVPSWKNDIQRRIDDLRQRVLSRELRKEVNLQGKKDKRETHAEKLSRG